MEPKASPLLYIATLLGLTTLSVQQIFNHMWWMELEEAEMLLVQWDFRLCLWS